MTILKIHLFIQQQIQQFHPKYGKNKFIYLQKITSGWHKHKTLTRNKRHIATPTPISGSALTSCIRAKLSVKPDLMDAQLRH